MPKPIRLLCVDDNDLVCDALSRRFSAPQFAVVKTLETADTLLEAVAEHTPDVVVLDLNMPGKDPISAVHELRLSHPNTRCVILTGLFDVQQFDRALAAGVNGLLSKGEEPAEIVDGVLRVAAGETVLGREVVRHYALTR